MKPRVVLRIVGGSIWAAVSLYVFLASRHHTHEAALLLAQQMFVLLIVIGVAAQADVGLYDREKLRIRPPMLRAWFSTIAVSIALLVFTASIGSSEERSTSTGDASDVACSSDLPIGGTLTSKASGDFDGDGAADRVAVYASSGRWIARGGVRDGVATAIELGLVQSTTGAMTVLGVTDLDGDGTDEVVVDYGGSGVGTIVGFLVVGDCSVREVTFDIEGRIPNHVSRRARLADGIRCWQDESGAHLVSKYEAERIDQPPAVEPFEWDVVRTDFRFDGAALVPVGDPTELGPVQPDDLAMVWATSITCDGVDPSSARS